MASPEGELSEAEKKTIEFGLAVAILASCSSSPLVRGPAGGLSSHTTTATSGNALLCQQRVSKRLRLWQGACLGGLAQAATGTKQHPRMTDRGGEEERRIDVQGGPRDVPREGIGNECLSALETPQLDRYGGPSAAGTIHRLLASDAASDLRALGVVALSGGESEGAKAAQKEALEEMWVGDCSPDMVQLFVKEMLGQIVLCGQGGCDGKLYRHVLNLLVSLVDGVAAAASSVTVAGATGTTTPSTLEDNEAAAAPTMSRRLDIALAVSEAFDSTLVKLARELREGIGGGGRQGFGGCSGGGSGRRRRESPSSWPPSAAARQHRTVTEEPSQLAAAAATARASGAGLYFDAYEAVVACMLQAFDCFASGVPEQERGMRPSSPSSGGAADTLRRTWPPGGSSRGGGDAGRPSSFGSPQSTCNTPTTTTVSGMMVSRGLMPRGWNAEARRDTWTQRKLDVLAEAMTAMSSFRIGQLRLQRVVFRLYGRVGFE
ncbi:unnamed protein product [Hapterophycus canaliculatus]